MNDSVLIVCDSHISIYDYEKQNQLIKLIDSKKDIFGTLVLLGDIFDFYFNYNNFIPKNYFPLFNVIKNLSETKKIYIAEGNHDMWLGDFFSKFLNTEVKSGVFELKAYGKKYLLSHGDEFESKSIFRKIADFILSSRISEKMFALLHPEIGYQIGRIVSSVTSSGKNEKEKILKMKAEIKRIRRYADFDSVIIGHSHQSAVFEEEKIIFLGDYKGLREYAFIDEKGVRIEHF